MCIFTLNIELHVSCMSTGELHVGRKLCSDLSRSDLMGRKLYQLYDKMQRCQVYLNAIEITLRGSHKKIF